MSFMRSGGAIPRIMRPYRHSLLRIRSPITPLSNRAFHAVSSLLGTKSQVLKDVGEGELQVSGVHLPEVLGLVKTNLSQVSPRFRSYNGTSRKERISRNGSRYASTSLIKQLMM